VLLPRGAKETQPFAYPKFNKAVSILPSEAKAPTIVILPLGKPDWLNWSSDEENTLGLAS